MKLWNYQVEVDSALTAALERAREQAQREGLRQLDISSDKLVILSDLHRGARNRADDFRASERAYNAALAYYYRMGYTLVSLGDMEELWEERPAAVLRAYERSLDLEAAFHRAGRLIRIWGNHDDQWRYPDEAGSYLGELFGGEPLHVYDSLLLEVVKGEAMLGTLFLLHGHQGTLDSDRFGSLSRVFVRRIWRPVQRLTNWSFNTPAEDWQLRQGHNLALYNWSRRQEKLVLVAGHTHRPVFKSRTHEAKLQDLLDAEEEKLALDGDDPDVLQRVSELAAELEWVRAQQRDRPQVAAPVELEKPCYFNTGCCCYSDGDITGLEIAGDKITLVRWPDGDARPLPKPLESADLESDVFARC
jgi:UDP-2,3-diacylglucosamine pyrophosphatase LpxH